MSGLYAAAMLLASMMGVWEFTCVPGATPRGEYVTCAAGEAPIVLCTWDGCATRSGTYEVADIIEALGR